MRNYTVDGTEADGFTLSADGRSAPFGVFNIAAQDWVLPFHRYRWAARLHAFRLNVKDFLCAVCNFISRLFCRHPNNVQVKRRKFNRIWLECLDCGWESNGIQIGE